MQIICIPTSLSGGEYTAFAGGTNDHTRRKELFVHPSIGPGIVILDPYLCTTTPDRIWLSSGIRAVDHCIEAICSLQSKPDADEDAEKALRLLIPGLLGARASQSSIDARLKSQLGVIEAMKAVKKGVPMGASHGIGHQLGPYGVGHGETSCIMLPAVMQFNAPVNSDKQAKVLDIFWSEHNVSTLLNSKGYNRQDIDLPAALDIIIRELGLPRSLKEVGVNGEEIQDRVAEASLTDKYCLSNPIQLESKQQVLEILSKVH
jgi:alcohol dehydrogenase class IV